MILPINHIADWKYIRQHKQAQTEKTVIREKSTRIDHNNRVAYRVMIRKHRALKYEKPFKGAYEIVQR